MSELKADMAFEIGELVYFKGAIYNTHQTPNRYMVVERYVNECHGGIQRLYKLEGITVQVAEIALTRDVPTMDDSAIKAAEDFQFNSWIATEERKSKWREEHKPKA